MAKEDLVANKAFNYGGRRLKVGDRFQAPPSHAKVLTLTGKANTYIAPVMQATKPRGRPRKNPEPVQTIAGEYERRDMTPGTERAGLAADTNADHEE